MHPLLRRFAVLAPLAVAPAALAQPPADLLDQTRRLQAVAAQQVEADVRLGLSEAGRLTDKAQAAERYKVLLKRVEDDKTLPDDRRAALKHVLQDRIRIAETADAKDDAAPAKPRTQFAEGAPAKSASPAAVDGTKVKEGIAAVAALNQQGKQAEAQRVARELLQKHPDNVAVQVLNGVSTTASNLKEADAVRDETAGRRVVAMRDMDRSLAPPVGDVEFPKDWKAKSAERLKKYGLSAEEKAILEALAKPIKVEFRNSKLQDVMEYISTMTGRTIILDKNALEEGQLTYDTPINCALKTPVATRTALRAVLSNVNLTYVVRDGVIHVTNQARAKDLMVTRTYYIGDLVAGMGLFVPPPQLGATVDPQLAQNVQAVIDMIVQSVDPSSWTGRGGLGMIGFNIPTQSLIIRQSAEVHTMIRGSLNR
jgi:hypothetical protein